jgi:hypothetical protein
MDDKLLNRIIKQQMKNYFISNNIRLNEDKLAKISNSFSREKSKEKQKKNIIYVNKDVKSKSNERFVKKCPNNISIVPTNNDIRKRNKNIFVTKLSEKETNAKTESTLKKDQTSKNNSRHLELSQEKSPGHAEKLNNLQSNSSYTNTSFAAIHIINQEIDKDKLIYKLNTRITDLESKLKEMECFIKDSRTKEILITDIGSEADTKGIGSILNTESSVEKRQDYSVTRHRLNASADSKQSKLKKLNTSKDKKILSGYNFNIFKPFIPINKKKSFYDLYAVTKAKHSLKSSLDLSKENLNLHYSDTKKLNRKDFLINEIKHSDIPVYPNNNLNIVEQLNSIKNRTRSLLGKLTDKTKIPFERIKNNSHLY